MKYLPSLLTVSFSGSIFFYCCESAFEHLMICIAEGLKELGIPFYSNINYWKLSPEREEYLFCYDPNVTADDCSIVVVSNHWYNCYQVSPENLFHPKRQYITIHLDDTDGPITPSLYPSFRNYDYIFRTSCNFVLTYPSNFIPWYFGISNRIIQATFDLPKFNQKNKSFIFNFRVEQEKILISNFDQTQVIPGLIRTEPVIDVDNKWVEYTVLYPLRPITRHQFCPLIQQLFELDDKIDKFDQPPTNSYDYLQWKQTNQRHYPSYYERLKSSLACAAFAGYIVPGGNGTEPYLNWWDSWRFWESLAAGCVMFHADFYKYKAALPILPENGKHYIGVDFDNLEETIQRIADHPEILEQISVQGRQWAIENYGPVPTAIRFLEIVLNKPLHPLENQFNLTDLFTVVLPYSLSDLNFIVFPDWSQSEEVLSLELAKVIKFFNTYSEQHQLTLLLVINRISEEDANLILSAILMNLLLEEELEINPELELTLIGKLTRMQWLGLLPRLQGRIVLDSEDTDAIYSTKLEHLPTVRVEDLAFPR